MNGDDVRDRLAFAEVRLRDLLNLNGGDFIHAPAPIRQQLFQEFFFHLVGTTEILAQLVNEVRGLGLTLEETNISIVSRKLLANDPIKPMLAALTPKIRGKNLPSNPYDDDGYIFRILNYRHQVTHRRRIPFLFRVGAQPDASFELDPRNPSIVPSTKSIQEETQHMFNLIKDRCEQIIESL